MKIVQINSVCGIGSTGKLTVQISDYLNEKKTENYIAYGLGTSKRVNSFKFGNTVDAHLHSFISRKFCMQGYASHLNTIKLICFLKKENPEVVHLHNIHGHYLNFKLLFRYLGRCKCQVVWTFHDCWPMTGKCPHFTLAKCNKWKTLCDNCCQLTTYPDSVRDRSRKNYLDKKKMFTSLENLHIVTVSQWLADIARQSFFRGKDIRTIYNGIDLNVFQPRETTLAERLDIKGKFIILGVASVWNTSKGFEEFKALSNYLEDDERIVLIGLSKEQIAELPHNVIGISSVHDQKELSEYYAMASVLINLSMEETFGLVVAEALACGTPAIVIDSTACPELVSLETGIVLKDNRAKTVKDAVSQIKKAGKSTYSGQCRKRAETMFSKETMQKRYYDLYRNLEEKHETNHI